MNENISVIIPAYNEENYIKSTIEAIFFWPFLVEIIVVNDGSKDQTEKILEAIAMDIPIKSITLTSNQGKGQALMEGLKLATGSIIMFLDADLGESAKYATKLLTPILEKKADMTVAILPKSKKKAGFGFVKNLADKGIYHLTGFKSLAPLSGQRAMKREVIEQIPKLIHGFGIEVGLTIDAIKKGFSIREIEIPFQHRETGRDIQGFYHRGKEFIAVIRALYLSNKKYKQRATNKN